MEGICSATETVRLAIAGISDALMSEENSGAVAETANHLVGVSEQLKSSVIRFRL